MNALTGFAQGLQVAEGINSMGARGALTAALQSGDRRAAQNALAQLDPVAAYQMQQPDQKAQREAAAGLVRGVLAVDPQSRPQAWNAALRQAQAFGLDVSGVPEQYPGDEYAQMLGGMLGLGDQERSEFERLIATVGPEQARQAIQVRLGLAPRADRGLAPQSPLGKLRADLDAGLLDEETYKASVAKATQAGGGLTVYDPQTGQPIVSTGGQPVKLTEQQSKFTLFGKMMERTMPVIDGLEAQFNPANLPDQAAARAGVVGNFFKSQEYRRYETAGRAWAEGVLRLQTGAAATDGEIQRVFSTYFAQPGDTPEDVEFKRALRQDYADAVGAASGGLVSPGREGGELTRDQSPNAEPLSDENLPQLLDPGLLEFMTPEERALFE